MRPSCSPWQAVQSPHLPTPPNSGSIRWTGTLTAPQSGTYRFAITTLGAAKLYLDGALVLDVPGIDWETRFVDVLLVAGQSRHVRIDYQANSPNQSFLIGAGIKFGWVHAADVVAPNIQAAVQTARQADVAIVFATQWNGESFDSPLTLEHELPSVTIQRGRSRC